MKLHLERPIVFLDLETTGIDIINDKIIEICLLKIFPNQKEEIKTFRVNPQIPIPHESTMIHGISDEDIKNESIFEELAPTILLFLKDCDLAGYNSNKFDLPMLMQEFARCNINFDLSQRRLIDVQAIFHKMEQRTLIAAYKFYCNKKLINSHSAKSDTIATYEVLKSQLSHYKNLKNDVHFLSEFTTNQTKVDLMGRLKKNEENKIIFNFGKHKGKKVKDVFKTEPSYYHWIMKGNFPIDTKQHIKKVFEEVKKENK